MTDNLEKQIMVLAANHARVLEALEQIARKRKLDATAAASMQAIAIKALQQAGIWA
jgi:hypothetical protein